MTHLLPADRRMDGGKERGDGQSWGTRGGEGEGGEVRASVTDERRHKRRKWDKRTCEGGREE